MAFKAKYPGDCRDCDEGIHPGDLVEFDDNRDLYHVLCPDDATISDDLRQVPKPICPRCFLVMVGNGHGGWMCGNCDD